MTNPQQPHGPLRSFGRLKSRPVKPRQQALLDTLLPTIAVPHEAFQPLDLMPQAKETWLEIGFGGGEHMAAQAGRRPDVLVIGAEPFVNGVASAVRHVEEQALSNVRIHEGDARDVVGWLPDASIDRLFVMFPDPWHKARHNKRRIIQPEFVADLARVLKPGAAFRFATDWADYAEWTIERVLASPDFRFAEEGIDRQAIPADHVTTRYEEKKLGDCAPVFLDFVRA
ncbi:tRNA (guanosine(46)-N7)-methyltransferase TrmB [Caulobacter sp. 602-2]|uniref:tRNA (guanine-N(7)-)-methyltransferase n=1 Tax=Caulobacter sp. 602-2 TaxID=2710887 RepID=A0A6G4QY38_9CAUL|nr:tRNA (guanosine(46)-N7)-methyltransferase TrmB [Caulobacter sp. 602-2]NGM50155.1 tRNA (guanosine(46)-N7)-methyltransferase TrmB [Caulobacter sp. 602-2]